MVNNTFIFMAVCIGFCVYTQYQLTLYKKNIKMNEDASRTNITSINNICDKLKSLNNNIIILDGKINNVYVKNMEYISKINTGIIENKEEDVVENNTEIIENKEEDVVENNNIVNKIIFKDSKKNNIEYNSSDNDLESLTSIFYDMNSRNNNIELDNKNNQRDIEEDKVYQEEDKVYQEEDLVYQEEDPIEEVQDIEEVVEEEVEEEVEEVEEEEVEEEEVEEEEVEEEEEEEEEEVEEVEEEEVEEEEVEEEEVEEEVEEEENNKIDDDQSGDYNNTNDYVGDNSQNIKNIKVLSNKLYKTSNNTITVNKLNFNNFDLDKMKMNEVKSLAIKNNIDVRIQGSNKYKLKKNLIMELNNVLNI